ncbi:MAG: serine hydrolase [Clostridia bacterium]|nr:serine hydrolase [Clostridia bacterium]
MAIILSSCNVIEIPVDSAKPTPVKSEVPVDTFIPASQTATPSNPPSSTPTPAPTPTAKPNPTVNDLYEYLQSYLATYSGDYGLYFYNLSTDEHFGIMDKDKYIAASLSKVPINLYLYTLVEKGTVNLDTKVAYTEQDVEKGTGKIINEPFGTEYTLRELSKLSIEISDNCAINMIIRTVGKENFINYMNSLGAVIDYHTYRTCPYDMYLYFKELYRLYESNQAIYGELMGYLKNTVYNDKIPALLPKTVEVAHKIGDYFEIPSHNDAGIIFTEQPYILTLLCNEVNSAQALEIMQNASKVIYDFVSSGTLPAYSIDNHMMIPDRIVKEQRPSQFGFLSEVLVDNKVTKYYFDTNNISLPAGDEYGSELGVTTFRGSNYRDGGAYGTADIQEEKLEIIWDFDIGIIVTQSGGYWPGVGWTGQPSIVNWDSDVLKSMNVYSEFKSTDLKEVIYATMDGNIYFCDLVTGKWTREPIHMGYPTKGSVSVDERGYPLLYTGQGIDEDGTNYLAQKFRIYDLTDQSVIYMIEGNDENAFRRWFAFDSSGLLDSANDTFYEAGENGIIYKIKLNTAYDKTAGEITIDPVITKYRYKNPFGSRYGIESSPVIYNHYMYITDNSGLLACIDLNTLKTMWIYNLGDDADSSPTLEVTDEGVFLYAATEVDRQGNSSNLDEQYYPSYIRKFNALTGELIWQKEYLCHYDSVINGGTLGTGIIGKNDLKDVVIYSIAKTGTNYGGRLVALDKKTGNEVWAKEFNAYSWSSPTAVYSQSGKGYILYCTFAGQMHLIDGKTGEIKDTISLGANIEGTPAVYDNIAVVGSYAQKIFGIQIK